MRWRGLTLAHIGFSNAAVPAAFLVAAAVIAWARRDRTAQLAATVVTLARRGRTRPPTLWPRDGRRTRPTRATGLEQLTMLAGTWSEQIDLPGIPAGRMSVEWTLSTASSCCSDRTSPTRRSGQSGVIAPAEDGAGYVKHYFNSRGAVRGYADPGPALLDAAPRPP